MRELIETSPCRYCGGDPSLWRTSRVRKYVIRCDICGAQIKKQGTVYDAVAEWNEGRAVKGGGEHAV